jgi:hypothetical protein
MRIFHINLPSVIDATSIVNQIEIIAQNTHNGRPPKEIRKRSDKTYGKIISEFVKTKNNNKEKKEKNKGKKDKDKEKLETLINTNTNTNAITTNTITKEFVDALVLQGVIFTDEYV